MSCATRASDAEVEHDQRSVELAIIDQTQWHTYPASEDPLPDHEPETVKCGSAGFYLTPQSIEPELEIDTAYCNYALLTTDTLRPLARGARIALELRHFELQAELPAQAHVALFFDQALAWETYIDIPHDAEVAMFSWRAASVVNAGTPVRLHLHNHGQNTWVIAALTTH